MKTLFVLPLLHIPKILILLRNIFWLSYNIRLIIFCQLIEAPLIWSYTEYLGRQREDGEKSGWIIGNREKIFWLDFSSQKMCVSFWIMNKYQIIYHIPHLIYIRIFLHYTSYWSDTGYDMKRTRKILIPHSSCFHFLGGSSRSDSKGK